MKEMRLGQEILCQSDTILFGFSRHKRNIQELYHKYKEKVCQRETHNKSVLQGLVGKDHGRILIDSLMRWRKIPGASVFGKVWMDRKESFSVVISDLPAARAGWTQRTRPASEERKKDILPVVCGRRAKVTPLDTVSLRADIFLIQLHDSPIEISLHESVLIISLPDIFMQFCVFVIVGRRSD